MAYDSSNSAATGAPRQPAFDGPARTPAGREGGSAARRNDGRDGADRHEVAPQDRRTARSAGTNETSGVQGTRDMGTLFRLFVGKNADTFDRIRLGMETAESLKAQGASIRERWRFSRQTHRFNWVVFFFGPMWFFYRKLYVEAAAAVLFPIVLVYVFPELAKITLSLAIVLGGTANTYYVSRAKSKIAAIEQTPLSAKERDALIASQGGVSKTGLVLGLMIFMALVGLTLFKLANGISRARLATALPRCGSNDVKREVGEFVISSLRGKGLPTTGVRVTDFREIRSTDDRRDCRFVLRTAKGERTLSLSITWQDKASKRSRIQIGGAPP